MQFYWELWVIQRHKNEASHSITISLIAQMSLIKAQSIFFFFFSEIIPDDRCSEKHGLNNACLVM